MIVMKFGGSSIASSQRIKKRAKIIKKNLDRKPIVVTSALEGVTDSLQKLANQALKKSVSIKKIEQKHLEIIEKLSLKKEIIFGNTSELKNLLKGILLVKELTPKTLDYVLSFGERMSSKILAAYLSKINVPSRAINTYDLGLLTDSNFGNANPLQSSFQKIKKNLNNLDFTPVLTGFIGKTVFGDITTLGRGGSDYTATIIGSAISAEEVQIWTDVNGVMTADPSTVKEAMTIKEMSFEEASELAYFGAKVLQPAMLIPAVKKSIPVRVLNSMKPKEQGTVILNRIKKTKGPVKSIVYKENLILINIVSTRMLMQPGFMAKVFEIFNRLGIIIDMIATSEVSISLTTDSEKNVAAAKCELSEFSEVTVERNKTIICVVGDKIKNQIGLAGKIFSALRKANINIRMISQGASKVNIAFLVDDDDLKKTVKTLHRLFFEKK